MTKTFQILSKDRQYALLGKRSVIILYTSNRVFILLYIGTTYDWGTFLKIQLYVFNKNWYIPAILTTIILLTTPFNFDFYITHNIFPTYVSFVHTYLCNWCLTLFRIFPDLSYSTFSWDLIGVRMCGLIGREMKQIKNFRLNSKMRAK